jgi:aminopeptidase N
VFTRVLHEWVATYRHALATTGDFRALAARVAGRDLDDVFTPWLDRVELLPLPRP